MNLILWDRMHCYCARDVDRRNSLFSYELASFAKHWRNNLDHRARLGETGFQNHKERIQKKTICKSPLGAVPDSRKQPHIVINSNPDVWAATACCVCHSIRRIPGIYPGLGGKKGRRQV